MKYQANPVIVEAHKILSVDTKTDGSGELSIVLDNGECVTPESGMTARYTPVAGDYWVIQADGYIYLNPKDVFERKYSPLPLTAGHDLGDDY